MVEKPCPLQTFTKQALKKPYLLLNKLVLFKAEEAMKQKDACGNDISGILPNTDKKRKRTSIAAPEKRLLEDYFRFDSCKKVPNT